MSTSDEAINKGDTSQLQSLQVSNGIQNSVNEYMSENFTKILNQVVEKTLVDYLNGELKQKIKLAVVRSVTTRFVNNSGGASAEIDQGYFDELVKESLFKLVNSDDNGRPLVGQKPAKKVAEELEAFRKFTQRITEHGNPYTVGTSDFVNHDKSRDENKATRSDDALQQVLLEKMGTDSGLSGDQLIAEEHKRSDLTPLVTLHTDGDTNNIDNSDDSFVDAAQVVGEE